MLLTCKACFSEERAPRLSNVSLELNLKIEFVGEYSIDQKDAHEGYTTQPSSRALSLASFHALARN